MIGRKGRRVVKKGDSRIVDVSGRLPDDVHQEMVETFELSNTTRVV